MCVSCFERKDCFIFWDDLKGLQIIYCNRFLQIIAFLIGWLSDDIIYSALVSSLVCFQSESTPSFEALVRGWLRTHSTICCRRPSRLGLSSTQPWTIHWHVETSFPSLFHSMSENLSNLCPAWTLQTYEIWRENNENNICDSSNSSWHNHSFSTTSVAVPPASLWQSSKVKVDSKRESPGGPSMWPCLSLGTGGRSHPSSFIVHRSSSNCPSFLWKSCPSASARWSTARS